jgi:putative oxidoreductase
MRIQSLEPYCRSVLRIVAGFLFSLHGWQKLFGILGGAKAEPLSLFWVAGVLETFGGALIVLGLFTRPVALILAGQMAVAYYRAHLPRGPWPILNGGELAALYCFLFLWLGAAGAAPWSLDRLARKKG